MRKENKEKLSPQFWILTKLRNKVSHGNYKRTWQGVPTVFLYYLYDT